MRTRDIECSPIRVQTMGVAPPDLNADGRTTFLHLVAEGEDADTGGVVYALSPALAINLLAQIGHAVQRLPYTSASIAAAIRHAVALLQDHAAGASSSVGDGSDTEGGGTARTGD